VQLILAGIHIGLAGNVDNEPLATLALIMVLAAVIVIFRRRIQILLERTAKALGASFSRSIENATSNDEIVLGDVFESQGDEQGATKHVPRGF
jgi:hypothetical protein